MVLTPDGYDGRLIASINRRNVGFAEQVSAEGKTPRYAVSLQTNPMGIAMSVKLVFDRGAYFLRPRSATGPY